MTHGDYIRHVDTNDSFGNLSSNECLNGGKLSAGNEACKPNEFYWNFVSHLLSALEVNLNVNEISYLKNHKPL